MTAPRKPPVFMRPRPCTICGELTESAIVNAFDIDDQQHPACYLAEALKAVA